MPLKEFLRRSILKGIGFLCNQKYTSFANGNGYKVWNPTEPLHFAKTEHDDIN